MKFYNRKKELELLEKNRRQSERSATFTVMVGRRRMGKTALLLESVRGRKHLYLFVSRQSEPLLCARFQKEAAEALGIRIFGTVTRFRDLFEQLLDYATRENYTLIIDEFQEFESVNPAIFGEVQDVWDRYRDRAKINFIVCGSIWSMMVKIFEDRKEPLFGRATSKITLQPFTVGVIKKILGDFNPRYTPDDLLCLYALTGGVPRYIALLMTAGATTRKRMLDAVASPDSTFLGEGRELLISEFGREYGTYFSILQLIASGKTSQSEIDSIIGKNTGSWLVNLEREYSLIVRTKPMFAKPESRRARWSIADNYLRFWFRFIYPNQSMIEMGKHSLLREAIERDYEQYSGLALERYFRDKTAETERVTSIGGYWDRRGENEIDMVALNDIDKTAIVAEVKRNPRKIDLPALAAKAATLKKELAPYRVALRGYSLQDM